MEKVHPNGRICYAGQPFRADGADVEGCALALLLRALQIAHSCRPPCSAAAMNGQRAAELEVTCRSFDCRHKRERCYSRRVLTGGSWAALQVEAAERAVAAGEAGAAKRLMMVRNGCSATDR